MLLEVEVVGSGAFVLDIERQVPLGLGSRVPECLHEGEYLVIDWDSVEPHVDTKTVSLWELGIPRVLHDLLQSQSAVRLDVDQLGKQVLVLGGHLPVDQVHATLDLGVQDRSVVVLEGQLGHQHREEHNPQGPDVSQLGVVSFPSDHLRGGVARGPAGSDQLLLGPVHIGESEVHNLQFFMYVKEHVLWLDVAMCYAEAMEVL